MIQIPKGCKDVLPSQAYQWQYLEAKAREIAAAYAFKEIRTPVFEHTELFSRGVGDTTDIVNKEMYTFLDKGGRSVTLRPEGTAGVARAFIEHGLAGSALPFKAYYLISAFRYERPQAGRLREFHQFGCELYGAAGAAADAETISLADAFLRSLGLKKVELRINSIGCKHCRARYHQALKEYFAPHIGEMCDDCRARFDKNPMRILDCKVEGCKKIAEGAPRMLDYLCDDCRAHFEQVKTLLSEAGIVYTVDPSIVRGLDYYSRTVFEFVSDAAGAQGTVLGGGRYDTLLEQMDSKSVPGRRALPRAWSGFCSSWRRKIVCRLRTRVPCVILRAWTQRPANRLSFWRRTCAKRGSPVRPILWIAPSRRSSSMRTRRVRALWRFLGRMNLQRVPQRSRICALPHPNE